MQFPSVGQDTEVKSAYGSSDWMPSSNCAGRAVSHSPSIDVIVNASVLPSMFLNDPTAMQYPGDEHDTSLNFEKSDWKSRGNCAGCAGFHSPPIEVMVNAGKLPALFLNDPTAVQFPSVGHETELNCESGFSDWMPSSNCAGSA